MKKPFWAEGIRFECQQTGRCCTSRGEYGYVYLTAADRRALARHLGLSEAELLAQHCEVTDGEVHLAGPERDCAFLKGSRCGVYEARPSQCRTWPFWPENMNARAWRREVLAFCPGVGQGRLYSRQEIDALVQIGARADSGLPGASAAFGGSSAAESSGSTVPLFGAVAAPKGRH